MEILIKRNSKIFCLVLILFLVLSETTSFANAIEFKPSDSIEHDEILEKLNNGTIMPLDEKENNEGVTLEPIDTFIDGYRKGDLNRDGCLDERDTDIILGIIKKEIEWNETEWNDIYLKYGDMSRDGKISMIDYSMLLARIKEPNEFPKGDLTRDVKLSTDDTDLMLKIINGEIEGLAIHIKLGDLDEDGELTLTDYFKLLIQVKNPSDYEKGDINMDGKITIEDANIILDVVKSNIKYDDAFLVLGDMNDDKKISLIDYSQILSIAKSRRKKGDLDRNGVITANDASIALDLYKNGNATTEDIFIGDMDNNGAITANDASMILDMYKNGK